MPSDKPKGSPAWWIEMLEPKLDKQARDAAMYERYYDGLQVNWTMQTPKYRDYFKQMIQAVSDNWMPIVVDAVGERLSVQGFRMGKNTEADEDAWDIWQYNNFDAISDQLFTTVLTAGVGAAMVWTSGKEDYPIKWTAEHPSEVYVATSPSSKERVAAIKRWRDEWDEQTRLNLYLPDFIYKFYKDSRYTNWTPMPLEFRVPNQLGKVPVVEFRNRVNLKPGSYKSELKEVTSTQDQINKLVMDLLIASEFGSFQQRWATGVETPIGEDGKPIDTIKVAMDRILLFEDPEVKLGQFQATALTNFIGAIESRIQSLASRSRTPAHYLLGNAGTFPSGESLKATETGLISKVKRRHKDFSDPLEEMVRLSFDILDDPRADIMDSEVIWADPESRTEAEHVDALVKKLSLGVPAEQLWLDAGYTPTQVTRFKRMIREEALARGMNQPVTISVGSQQTAPPALPSGEPTQDDDAGATNPDQRLPTTARRNVS